MRDRNRKLKIRVLAARKKMDDKGLGSQKKNFAMNFDSHGSHDSERLNNLFYCRAFDEDFTKDLEAFAEHQTKDISNGG